MDEEYDPLNAPLNEYEPQEEYAPEDFPEDTFEEDLAARLYEENLPEEDEEEEEEDVGEEMMEGMELEDEGMLEEEMAEAEMEQEEIGPLYAPLNEYGPQEEYAPEDFPEDNFEEELAERLYEETMPGEVVGEEMEEEMMEEMQVGEGGVGEEMLEEMEQGEGEFEGRLEEELESQGFASPGIAQEEYSPDMEEDFNSLQGEFDPTDTDYQNPNSLRRNASYIRFNDYMGETDVGAGPQALQQQNQGFYFAGDQQQMDRFYYQPDDGYYPATSYTAAYNPPRAGRAPNPLWKDSATQGDVYFCDRCGAQFGERMDFKDHILRCTG